MIRVYPFFFLYKKKVLLKNLILHSHVTERLAKLRVMYSIDDGKKILDKEGIMVVCLDPQTGFTIPDDPIQFLIDWRMEQEEH